MRYRFIAECPRCHKTSIVFFTKPLAKDNRVQCGDCLMNDIEIVEMGLKACGMVDDARPAP